MFKRENRLVPGIRFGNSNLSTSPQFVLKEKGNGLTINRFGIVVSKKIDKRAVVRNRIKRIFRRLLGDLSENMTSGHDILLIIKKEIENKTREENSLAVEKTLRKAGIIKK